MARDIPVEDGRGVIDTDTLPNSDLPHLITVIGRGTPVSFEITVEGEIELLDGTPEEEATVVSGSAVESSIEVGVQRFRFSGSQANVTIVDHQNEGSSESLRPDVHVDYGIGTE